jgi:hypothetical protein
VPTQQQQAQAGGSVTLGGLPPEAVGAFFGELEKAVRDRMPSAEVFAQAFVQRVGPGAAQAVQQAVSADEIIETARQATGGQSRIVTREGQRYVRQMWNQVSLLLSQPPPQQQTA